MVDGGAGGVNVVDSGAAVAVGSGVALVTVVDGSGCSIVEDVTVVVAVGATVTAFVVVVVVGGGVVVIVARRG